MHRARIAFLTVVLAAGNAAAQHGHDHGDEAKPCHPGEHDPRALAEDPRLAGGRIAPVLAGLGEHHHRVTTSVPEAQRFFDQGLLLSYGFNHQEALRAFKEAARLDPDCAMAYWGWAYVLGPNLNLPMSDDYVEQALEAINLALERKSRVSQPERDYIDALAKRYGPPGSDRAALDQAFAEATRALHAKYPDDDDAATLHASALMNLNPWNYWTRDGRPKANTEEALRALETVIERDPRHEGALHYHIHLVEAADPKRGTRSADLLRGLAPGAGHLMHMPSHIYMQLGRYAESYEDNALAADADEGYITQCRAQGIYPLNYYPHNVHFLAWAAIMQGRSNEALAAARKVAGNVPPDLSGNDWALYETFLSMPLFTLVRFGKWDEVLSEPKPREETRYWSGMWHYARGMAYTHQGQVKDASKERERLADIASQQETSEVPIGFSNAGRLLEIANAVLSGEIAAARGRYEEAIGHLDRAVRLEDGLNYQEPPDWYYPVRHTLGAVLLEAGRPDEAEVVYWDDLRTNPDNGYALLGLAQSLRAQGRDEEAESMERRFREAWSAADVKLTSSRY